MMTRAKPYEARQCPLCKLWVYTAAGPFAENDETKTQADYFHWEAAHATAEQLAGPAVSFPYFQFNEDVVDAYIRDDNRDAVLAVAKTSAGYGLLDTPCEPRRSAYVDGPGGDEFYARAVDRWQTYQFVLSCAGPTTSTLEFKVTIETDGDAVELARSFGEYLTTPGPLDLGFLSDYAADGVQAIRTGYEGPFVRAIKVEEL